MNHEEFKMVKEIAMAHPLLLLLWPTHTVPSEKRGPPTGSLVKFDKDYMGTPAPPSDVAHRK
jgi:hypothetical protein